MTEGLSGINLLKSIPESVLDQCNSLGKGAVNILPLLKFLKSEKTEFQEMLRVGSEVKDIFQTARKIRKYEIAKVRWQSKTFIKKIRPSLMAIQNNKCANCRIDISIESHIDHIVPISRGGESGIDNLQLLCPTCNMLKGDKLWQDRAK